MTNDNDPKNIKLKTAKQGLQKLKHVKPLKKIKKKNLHLSFLPLKTKKKK